MPYAHIADQIEHVPRMEYITDLSIALTQIQFVAVTDDDARRVLAPVLQHQ
ncbi:hypothetical protein MnTg03_01022 [bacterium MnTg03]|nr:hypothetical protein MnTg03_01022 [bacterium MnTg03]